MKKMRSMPFRRMSTQNNHQLALLGNKSVKQRRGWSRRNLNSSQTPLLYGTHLEQSQIVKRSIQGKPVLPMMMRKVPKSRGRTHCLKRTMESGFRVNPKSLNMEAGVKKPLPKLTSTPELLCTMNDLPPHRAHADLAELTGVISVIHDPGKQAYHAQ
jgi:hypothetical protein